MKDEKKRRQKHMMTLRTKLILIAVTLLIIPTTLVGSIAFRQAQNELNELGRMSLKNDVRYVIAMIERLDEQVKKGELPLEEAQERIRETILGKRQSDGTRPITRQFDLGENGYLFVLDEKADVIAHPKLEGTNIWDLKSEDGVFIGRGLVEKGKVTEGGFLEYKWELPTSKSIEKKITYAEKDPHWGWIVCAGTYMLDFNAGASNILYKTTLTVMCSLVIGGIMIGYIANRFVRPVLAIEHTMKQLANGNLDTPPLTIHTKDEIGRLSESVNRTIEQLREMIHVIQSHSSKVASSSFEFATAAEETSQATSQISITMQEISTGSEEQKEIVDQTTASIKEVSDVIDAMQENGFLAVEASKKAYDTAHSGERVLDGAVQQMGNIHRSSDELAGEIQSLANTTKAIEQIVYVISEIAEQTNLLALNASIEAARAGEHGKGFAVVAGEVRKLAEQSAKSTSQITSLIRSIQSQAQSAVERMQHSKGEIAQGVTAIATASDRFKEIKAAVSKVTTTIQEVSDQLQVITQSTKSIVHSFDLVNEKAEAMAGTTEGIAAATEQQLATMEQISASATALSQLADMLQQSAARFKLS